MPSVGKAFVVGPSYAPILGKLLAKITSGTFVELGKPHTYLDGKLLIAPAKKRVVEITDILTWIQAFTIYQWIFCSTYPSRWQDTTQYKLLILQMACQFPRPAWLNDDMAFRKDAAAYFLTDWSQMNLNLYNFHTRASSTITGQSAPRLTSWPIPQPHRTSNPSVPSTPFSIVDPGMMAPVTGLWVNVGIVMSAKDAMVNTPLSTVPFEPTRGLGAPGPSLHPGENAVGVNKVALQVAAPSYVNTVSSSLTVPCSTFAFTGVDSQQKPGLNLFFNDSCSSALALLLHQPLLPPYKVSPIRVE